MLPTFKLDGEVYQQVPKQAIAMTDAITYAWEKLGKPETPLSTSGQKMMDVIIATWEDTYPILSSEWKKARDLHLSAEKTIHEQVSQHTGRSLASYPMYIYTVMKKVFPKFDLSKRENVIKLVKLWPIFRFVNKV